jgi:carbon-monoxide dehydrogenase medium subunit
MIPAPFDYHRPRSIDEALALLATHGDDGRVIAGGHSLIPMMKLRLATPGHLIDLRSVAGLGGIAAEGGAIAIGALATQQEVAASPLLAERCPILRETALQIADPQVRYCGTIGGNVANGDPGNDMPAVMQALDAAYVLRGAAGERRVAARDFYQGPYVTALAEGEILTGIRIQPPPAGHGWAYAKMKRKVGDYATAAAAVLLQLDAGGTCRQAAIALTNVGDTPLLAAAAAAALVGTRLEPAAIEAAAAAAMAITRPAGDGRGPPEFRTHVAGVMVRRAIETARQRARKG